MGTCADFYIGSGAKAEWLGSVALNGDVWAKGDGALRRARTKDEFRRVVALVLAGRKDATLPDMGWPWPWTSSQLSDYAYFFEGGGVKWAKFGIYGFNDVVFPDMRGRRKLALNERGGFITADYGRG